MFEDMVSNRCALKFETGRRIGEARIVIGNQSHTPRTAEGETWCCHLRSFRRGERERNLARTSNPISKTSANAQLSLNRRGSVALGDCTYSAFDAIS